MYVVFFFVFYELRWEVLVDVVDIGGIVDHHYLKFLFIIDERPFQKGCYPLLRTRGYPLVIMNMKEQITHVVIGNSDHYFIYTHGDKLFHQFLAVPHCQFLDACSGEKHTTYRCLWWPLSLKFKEVDVIDIVIKHGIIWRKDIYVAECEIVEIKYGLASFHFSSEAHVWSLLHTNIGT